jgi:hypothetical protein
MYSTCLHCRWGDWIEQVRVMSIIVIVFVTQFETMLNSRENVDC